MEPMFDQEIMMYVRLMGYRIDKVPGGVSLSNGANRYRIYSTNYYFVFSENEVVVKEQMFPSYRKKLIELL